MTAKKDGASHIALDFELTLFFLLRVVAFTAVAIASHFLSTAAGYSLLALSSVVIFFAEINKNVKDPISYAVFLVASLGATYLLLNDQSKRIPSVPIILFLTLLLGYLTYSITKRPFMNIYAVSEKSEERLEFSIIWLIAFSLLSITAILATNSAVSFWLFALIPLIATSVQLYFMLGRPNKSWNHSKIKTVGELRFQRIPNDKTALRAFYTPYIQEMLPAMQEGGKVPPVSLEEFIDMKMDAEQSSWHKTGFFAAYHGEKIIGTISCMLDEKGFPLPIETGQSSPINLDGIRKYGGITELARLSIHPEYRFDANVLSGLFLCGIEYSLERHASFMVTQTVLNAATIYKKIGFQTLLPHSVINQVNGIKVMLVGFNLAARMEGKVESNAVSGNISQQISADAVLRFVIGQRLKRLIFGEKSLAARLSNQDLLNLVTPYPENTSEQTSV